MEPSKEQFYLRRIAELEKRNAAILKENAKLAEQVAKLRENPLQITEYRLYGYRCSICGEVVWAELPPGKGFQSARIFLPNGSKAQTL